MKLRLTAKVESKASIDQFVTLEKNMPKANFWVVCSGDFAGMPTKEFKPEYIGVKVAWLPFLSPNVVFDQAQKYFHAGVFRSILVNGELTIDNLKILLNKMAQDNKK